MDRPRRSPRLALTSSQAEKNANAFLSRASEAEQKLREDAAKPSSKRRWPLGSAHLFHQRCKLEASLRRAQSSERTRFDTLVP